MSVHIPKPLFWGDNFHHPKWLLRRYSAIGRNICENTALGILMLKNNTELRSGPHQRPVV